MSKTLLTIFVALLLAPTAQAVTDIPVENEFAAFTLPKGWKVIESKSKDLPKPLVYFRQKYVVTVVTSVTGSAYLYAQDLPTFRGDAMPLADIDAAFERTSQLSSDTSAIADNYIPSIMDLKSSTGTFLSKPSREIEFWTERGDTVISVRMSYASFGGKLYAIEFYTTKKINDANADWKTLHDSMYVRSSPKPTDSKKASPANVDRSPRGSKTKLKIRRGARRQNAMKEAVHTST